MVVHKDVLFLILARSGSKGLPGKNIRCLGGKPLLAYRILSAKKSTYRSDVVLSTDSEEYAEIGKSWGAEVPFLRPFELSTDSAKSIDAVIHAVDFMKDRGRTYQFICLLEPTSPLTKIEWVDAGIKRLIDEGGRSLVACKYTSPHPFYIQDEGPSLSVVGQRIFELKETNRQGFPRQMTPSGNFYIAATEFLEQNLSFYTAKTLAMLIPDLYSLEIDTERDFQWAEFLIEKSLVESNF